MLTSILSCRSLRQIVLVWLPRAWAVRRWWYEIFRAVGWKNFLAAVALAKDANLVLGGETPSLGLFRHGGVRERATAAIRRQWGRGILHRGRRNSGRATLSLRSAHPP